MNARQLLKESPPVREALLNSCLLKYYFAEPNGIVIALFPPRQRTPVEVIPFQ
jgi:hypothetical protein